jgi:MFS family permease
VSDKLSPPLVGEVAGRRPAGGGKVGLASYRNLLRSRDFSAFWAAQTASLVGDVFSFMALAWLVLQLTGSAAALGAVLAVQGIPRVLLMLVGGAVSDRISPRSTMLLSAAGRTLVAGALAALVLDHAALMWHVYVGAFLLGAVSAFFMPAQSSILPQLVDAELLEAGNAALQVTRQVANTVGPALAGLTVAAGGTGAALAVDATCFALAAGLLLLVRGGAAAAPGRPGLRVMLRDVGGGLTYVWRSVPLRALLFITLMLNLAFAGPYTIGITILARDRLGGAVALGWILGGTGVGAVVGALVTGALGRPRRLGWVMVGLMVWLGAGLALMGPLPSLALVVACGFLIGLAVGFGNTFATSWIQRITEPAMLGRVMALVLLAAVGLAPISYAVAGVIAQVHPVVLFAAAGGIMLLTGLACAGSRTFRAL